MRRPASTASGIALYMTLIVVLMITLLIVAAARNALFQEMLNGNDADYQRTFEAAQILMADAEIDIRRRDYSGNPCADTQPRDFICRTDISIQFPNTRSDLAQLVEYLDTLPTGCAQGICKKRTGIQNFWSDASLLLAMTADGNGARYGQFTGAPSGPGSHPVLAARYPSARVRELYGAWYWVEILPLVDANVSLLSQYEHHQHLFTYAPDKRRPWVYRITVYAHGKKQGTEVVLQSVVSMQPAE